MAATDFFGWEEGGGEGEGHGLYFSRETVLRRREGGKEAPEGVIRGYLTPQISGSMSIKFSWPGNGIVILKCTARERERD